MWMDWGYVHAMLFMLFMLVHVLVYLSGSATWPHLIRISSLQNKLMLKFELCLQYPLSLLLLLLLLLLLFLLLQIYFESLQGL